MAFAALLPLAFSFGQMLGNKIAGNKNKNKTQAATVSTPDPKLAQLDTEINNLRQQEVGVDPATAQARAYLSTILGGSEEETGKLLGGEVNTILSQYDAGAKAVSELGSRGGGKNALLSSLPFQKAGAYGKILAGAQPTAASGLAQIGAKESERKDDRAAKELATLVGDRSELRNQQSQLRQQDFVRETNDTAARNKSLSELGSSFGSILVDILGRKKSSGGGTGSAGNSLDLGGVFDFLKR